MSSTQVALKEWSVIVEAVTEGLQLLLVRKGGIRDPKGAFALEHREFLLYPTQEHQREEGVRPEFRGRFQRFLRPQADQAEIPFRVYAGVAFSKEIQGPAALSGLERYHIWTPEFLKARLQYRPQSPASVLVIRAYRLKRPVVRPVLPGYAGCKSWVSLEEPVPLEGAEPVMDNRRFRAALEEITSRLSG